MEGMINHEDVDTGIVFGNGKRLKSVCTGDKQGVHCGWLCKAKY